MTTEALQATLSETAAAEETTPTPTETQTELESIREELKKQKELVKKLRVYEKENKDVATVTMTDMLAKDAELQSLKQEHQTLKDTLKSRVINESLVTQLTAAGAVSVPTALKLINMSGIEVSETDLSVSQDSIKVVIEELRKSDPILFKSGGDPSQTSETVTAGGDPVKIEVKRVSETEPVGGYEKEIRGAKSQKEIVGIMKKYGKLT